MMMIMNNYNNDREINGQGKDITPSSGQALVPDKARTF